ncbi:hypothetical protein V2J09_004180 [Rumex salicifolius]
MPKINTKTLSAPHSKFLTSEPSQLPERSSASKMDVKAMARSKRSHTIHHQPRKPHRPATQSTASSSSSSKDPKVLNKEGEKKRSNLGNSLPSNLDRYYDSDEEEGLFGSDSESAGGPISDAAKTDVVKPKSKGADFGFLISEALSQSPANFTESFDSVLPDFSQVRGSMLSVRGENILLWSGGDDFLMEDGRTTNQEGSFLSLDPHKLSKDIAKLNHSQRLFIEEDILPPEMKVSQKDDKDGKMAVSTSVEQSSEVDDMFTGSSKIERKMVSKESQSLDSNNSDTTDRLPYSFRQEKQSADFVAAYKSDSLGILDPKKSFKASQQETELDNKMPRFEAKAAEAELDMLLSSFNEAEFFDSSSNMGSNVSSAVIKEKTCASSLNMDNDIDGLLEEKTNFAGGNVISDSTEVNANDSMGKQVSSGPSTGTKSLVMEDFDSWLDTI